MKSLGSIRRSFAPWNDPQEKSFVAFDGVTKKFGQFAAVSDLTLHICKREFFALLGGSGCGKSTLLRMLAGFEKPTAGTITLDGEDMAGIPPYGRPVNMMFQTYALFPHMSVEKNVAFGLKQDGMAKSEISDRVGQMLKMVKLEPFAKRRPQQLSGGQRQRVALARSLVKRPKVLLLDEPLGALDKKLREETQFELMDLQQDLGLNFIVVTHDQEEAMVMADRIAVMSHGKVIQIATPAEIYEAPNSRFVAGFIGDVNFFEGTVEKKEAGRVEIAGEDGFAILADGECATEIGGKVGFAVRPEKIRVRRKKLTAVNSVAGELWDIAYLGDMTVYHVKLKSGKVVKASSLNAVRAVEEPLGYDEEVWISFDPDAGVILRD